VASGYRQIACLVRNLPDLMGSPMALSIELGPAGGCRGIPYSARTVARSERLSIPRTQPSSFTPLISFRLGTAEKAEQLLLPLVPKLDESAVWLGELYGLAARGVTGVNLKNGIPVSFAEQLPQAAFAQKGSRHANLNQ